jgi:ribosome-associated toxin RatA of RatAB toxin-antitoxin module
VDVQTEEILDQPYALVLKAILAESGTWLPGLVKDAADRLVTDLGIRFKGVRLARSIAVEVSPPTIYPDRCEICVAWKAAESSALFPELGGAFELVAIDAGRSRLSFEASYEPPGRALGQVTDRALMHRVAESSVRDFVRRTARILASRAESIKSGAQSTQVGC